jgi:hypothetical protein
MPDRFRFKRFEAYMTLRAQLETPEKAALVYRGFRKAVHRCVLDWQAFRPELIMDMAVKDEIPKADREKVISYMSPRGVFHVIAVQAGDSEHSAD